MKQNKSKIRKFYAIAFIASIGLTSLILRFSNAQTPSVGAINNWFNVSNATQLSVDMTPNKGEGGYHFYSLSPFFYGQNYGLYAGIQTNGNLGNGVDVGNVFVFSVWNATVAYPEAGVSATPFGGEGVGYSLRKSYDWTVGRTYTITIKREGFDAGNNGYRWSASIKDKQSGSVTKLGEILAPSGANGLSGGSAFHERFIGSSPNCTASSHNLEAASVTFSNLSADKSASFTGTSAPNNIFGYAPCKPYIHVSNSTTKAVTGFGVTSSVFNQIVNPTSSPSTPKPSTPTTGSGGSSNNTITPGTSKPRSSTGTSQGGIAQQEVTLEDGSTVLVPVDDITDSDTPTVPSDPLNQKSGSSIPQSGIMKFVENNKSELKTASAIAIPPVSFGVFYLIRLLLFRI